MPNILNSFDGSMNQDTIYSRLPNTSWIYAMNSVIKDRNKSGIGLSPELSSKKLGSHSGVVGSLYLDHINSTLLIYKEGSFKLFNHDTEEEKEVFNQGEFSCNFALGNCEYHDVTYQVNRETFIYFSSNDTYYWFNLDEMLSPERKEGLKNMLSCEGCQKGCDYFKVFLPTCGIKINSARQKNSAGGSEVGSYIFFARYIDRNGGWTNWSLPSNRVNLTSKRNFPGEKSTDSAILKISGLDCKYNKIEIAFVKTVAGGFSAGTIPVIGYKGSKLAYEFADSEYSPITIADLLLSDQTNIYGRYLTVTNNQMYYYGLKSPQEYNVQKIANSIRTSVGVYSVPASVVKEYDLKSLMGGETYALGIWLNKEDGTQTYAGSIPVNGGEGGGESPDTLTSDEGATITGAPRKFISKRSDELEERSSGTGSGGAEPTTSESVIRAWETSLSDICTSLKPGCEGLDVNMFFPNGEINCDCGDAVDVYCESEEKKRNAEACFKDILKLDKLLRDIGDEQADHGLDILPSKYSSTSLKQSAINIINTIKQRERQERVQSTYKVQLAAQTYSTLISANESNSTSTSGDYTTATDGSKDFPINNYLAFTIPTVAKEERDIYYPCSADCKGEPIYGALAGTRVKHHRVPDRSIIPHFRSTSHGVLGKYNVEDPSQDLYINLLGLKFDNIIIPSEEELGFKVCPVNPYSIGMVPMTQSNKTIESKGVSFGTFIIKNGGKDYEQQRYGCNSKEEVSRYHNGTGVHPRLSNSGSGETCVIYSLDHLAAGIVPSATSIIKELDLKGSGERFGLWAKGKEPENSIKGARIDNRGTRQHIYLSQTTSARTEGAIDFIQSVEANKVASSDSHNKPLNNLSQQKCLWAKSSAITPKTDKSFTGDVLNQTVPISEGLADYVAFYKERPNQYGILDNLNYKPILSGSKSSVHGLCGDVYIGLWSILKTGYVSDKVGSAKDKFNIPAQVPIKKQKRCICDSPEDFIHEDLGQYTWMDLPEDGDASDAKNWAGTHTIPDSRTQPYTEAEGNLAISGYYIPKKVSTLISVPIESYICPWLTITGDTLEEQDPNDFDSKFKLDSGSTFDQDTAGWENAYLNQSGYQHKQASTWRKLVKAVMRIILVAWMPIWFLTDVTDIQGATDAIVTLAKYPLLYELWKQLKDQLLTNRIIDKLLGIPVCKTDDVGGEDDSFLLPFFKNFFRHNIDFTVTDSIKTIEGLPINFTDCKNRDHNLVYYSDPQNSFSLYDSLKRVRPGNRIEIPVEFGILTNLFTIRGNFYAHTTDHIVPLRYNNVSIATSIGEIKTGSGDLLSATYSLIGDVKEGYAGLSHKWLAKNTIIGYVFVDIDAGRVYNFTDNPTEITTGMTSFFKENTKFCTESDCLYERLEGVPHYDFTYDWLLDRLLITKVDGEGSSWTVSYSGERVGFISFHSYIPQIYLADRKRTYRIEEEVMYKMNELGSCRKIDGDKCSPWIVEYVVNSPMNMQSRDAVPTDNIFDNLSFNLETRKPIGARTRLNDVDSFFNKIAYYNQTQGSGVLSTELIGDNGNTFHSALNSVKEKGGIVKVTKRNRQYLIDALYDYKNPTCTEEPVVTQGDCDYTWKVNQAAFSKTPDLTTKYRGRIIDDKYLVVRLIKDDEQDIEYTLIDTKTTVRDGQ